MEDTVGLKGSLMKSLIALGAAAALLLSPITASAAPRPVVLELFTSQGCNSCPPADELLRTLADDPTLLALSFHVDYWDYIGWKDAFSLKASTDRQYDYAKRARRHSSFTPELIVDGKKSVIGSREKEVRGAIDAARAAVVTVPITLASAGATLTAHIGTGEKIAATVTTIRFTRNATTEVKAGENRGRSLVTVNSVTEIRDLGPWSGAAKDFVIPANRAGDEGVAILLQNPVDGSFLGAASYIGK